MKSTGWAFEVLHCIVIWHTRPSCRLGIGAPPVDPTVLLWQLSSLDASPVPRIAMPGSMASSVCYLLKWAWGLCCIT